MAEEEEKDETTEEAPAEESAPEEAPAEEAPAAEAEPQAETIGARLAADDGCRFGHDGLPRGPAVGASTVAALDVDRHTDANERRLLDAASLDLDRNAPAVDRRLGVGDVRSVRGQSHPRAG